MRDTTNEVLAVAENLVVRDEAPPVGRRRHGLPLPRPQAIDPGPSPDAIARRAYELFLERGATHGDDLSDWFRAEQELADPRRATPTIES